MVMMVMLVMCMVVVMVDDHDDDETVQGPSCCLISIKVWEAPPFRSNNKGVAWVANMWDTFLSS